MLLLLLLLLLLKGLKPLTYQVNSSHLTQFSFISMQATGCACVESSGRLARPPQLQLKLHIIITTLTYCRFPSLPPSQPLPAAFSPRPAFCLLVFMSVQISTYNIPQKPTRELLRTIQLSVKPWGEERRGEGGSLLWENSLWRVR